MSDDNADPLDPLAIDPDSTILSVETGDDGDVTIKLGTPDEPEEPEAEPTDHDDNLAEDLDEIVLAEIGSKLVKAIEADDQSRQGWLKNRSGFVEKLGFMVESVDGAGPSVNGISVVRHPILGEAVLRFQANARGELLPTDGPVKVRNDNPVPPAANPAPPAPMGAPPGLAGIGSNGGPPMVDPVDDLDDVASELETILNNYLTVTDSGYVPSTDKMLFWVGLGGMEFKKVYHHPLKRRPTSEWVEAKDVIVSNTATDLDSAGRVTQITRMRPAVLKRMQLAGVYRDIDLGEATDSEEGKPVEQAVAAQQGVEPGQTDHEEEDREREIYESYCELDIPGYEHKQDGKITGLPLPYKVTVDKDSKEVLEIRRNWAHDDEDCTAKQVFVAFEFVPGIGFYAMGLGHILGNIADAATGAWRMALDAAMLENFPGGLIAKSATREKKLNLMTGLGEFLPIETGDMPIQQAVMPLPFKGPSAALISLEQEITQVGSRIGGTAEMQVGEGRQDAPVGSTIALLEQARIPLDAVHKRLHQAQAKEFQLLKGLFREDPAPLLKNLKGVQRQWTEELLLKALNDFDIVPQADPNTSSNLQRQMKYALLAQLMEKAPMYFHVPEGLKAIVRAAKIPNGETYINENPPPPNQQQDPAKMLSAQAQMENAKANQAKVAIAAQEGQRDHAADIAIAQMKSQDNQRSLADQAADRASKEKLAALDYQKEMMVHHSTQQADMAKTVIGHHVAAGLQADQQQHDASMQAMGHHVQAGLAGHQRAMDLHGQLIDHAAAQQQQAFAHGGEVQRAEQAHQHDLRQAALEHQMQARHAMFDHATSMAQQQADADAKLEQIKAKPVPKPKPAGGK